MLRSSFVVSLFCFGAVPWRAVSADLLLPAASPAGYLARLLINETPFPGERGYVSESDSRDTQRALLLVIDARRHRIPDGYTRREIAKTDSVELFDILTAGGTRGQMDGFFRDSRGRPTMAPRVTARIARLQRIAGQGKPDRFARLLRHAQTLVTDYLEGEVPAPDLFAPITYIAPQTVTGNAYAWMTDQEYYHPGGDFIRIPNRLRGRLGGNRFYTLRKRTGSRTRRAAAGTPLVTFPNASPP
jgi:hypothetical protein